MDRSPMFKEKTYLWSPSDASMLDATNSRLLLSALNRCLQNNHQRIRVQCQLSSTHPTQRQRWRRESIDAWVLHATQNLRQRSWSCFQRAGDIEEFGVDTDEAEKIQQIDKGLLADCSFTEKTNEVDISQSSLGSGWRCLASWRVYHNSSLATGTSHKEFHKPR